MAVGKDEYDVVQRCEEGEEEGGGDAYADGGCAGLPVVDLEESFEDVQDVVDYFEEEHPPGVYFFFELMSMQAA